MQKTSKKGVLYGGYQARKKEDFHVHHTRTGYVRNVRMAIHGKSFPFGTVVSYSYNPSGHLLSIRAVKLPRYKGDKTVFANVWEYDPVYGEWCVNCEEFNNGIPDRLWDYWQKIRMLPEKGSEYRFDTGNTASMMQDAITRKKSSGGVVDAKHIHDITDYSGSKTVPFKDFTGSIPVLSGNFCETHSAYSRC